MKHTQQTSDAFSLGRGLALSMRKRGLAAIDAPAAIVHALSHLLADQPELKAVLVDLVQRPGCATLLENDQPQARASARQELLDCSGLTGPAHRLLWEQAFLDGLVQGWQEGAHLASPAVSGAWQEPDLRTWLLGLGMGVVIGAGIGWLGLVAFRLVAPAPQVSIPSGAPAGTSASNPKALPSLVPAPSAVRTDLQRCVKLASPQQESQRFAAASNYGKRLSRDADGVAIPATPSLIVLHETVIDLSSTVDLFQRSQANDSAQSSYHVLIGRNGERVRIVPDQDRAYGAGDSAFGDLRFKTSASNPPSINNIALHVSLESPADGRGDEAAHSGYTDAQYRALSEQVLRWQALFHIPLERLTTHAAVDRSHSRTDPRSFDWERFDQVYAQVRQSCA